MEVFEWIVISYCVLMSIGMIPIGIMGLLILSDFRQHKPKNKEEWKKY